jgi:hypothetical protein
MGRSAGRVHGGPSTARKLPGCEKPDAAANPTAGERGQPMSLRLEKPIVSPQIASATSGTAKTARI